MIINSDLVSKSLDELEKDLNIHIKTSFKNDIGRTLSFYYMGQFDMLRKMRNKLGCETIMYDRFERGNK